MIHTIFTIETLSDKPPEVKFSLDKLFTGNYITYCKSKELSLREVSKIMKKRGGDLTCIPRTSR